jgi:hypothetical protein
MRRLANNLKQSRQRKEQRWASLRCCVLIFVFLIGRNCFAQAPLSDLIFTVGTTARDGGNNDWSYLIIGTPSSELLAGKQFAVFGKNGDSASPNPFSQRGTMARLNDAGNINLKLSQASALGQNLALLNDSLNLTLRKVPGITNQPLANKVLTALQLAQTDASIATHLELMASGNPALNLCLGRAFAEQISTITTYELREIHPVTGAVGDVVGRATVTPGSPIVLPAPGRPVHVSTTEARDDLLIRLRWSTPDALRRLLLAGNGFNVWRIRQAVGGGYFGTPPTVAQLYSDTNFVRVNQAAVQAIPLTAAEASAGANTQTYFLADDNGRSRGSAPFPDGERYYYFVTARDVLGRDGLVSLGGKAQACRRRPPQAPLSLTVRDEPLADVSSNVLQRFRVAWQQNTNTNDVVTHYWVYRWPNPSMALTNDSVPLSNRVAVVQQLAGTNANSFLDADANSPTNPGPSVYWYTVRAVYEGSCGSVLSAHSAPVSGVLRERNGPDAPTGGVLGSCGTPAVMFSNFTRVAVSNLDTSRWQYTFSCDRRDSVIAWVQFFATNAQGVETVGPIYFAPNETRLEASYSLPRTLSVTSVACIVGSVSDQISRVASFGIGTANVAGQMANVSFFAGTLLLTAIDPTDPLLAELNRPIGGNSCFSANNVVVDPSGTISMTFPSIFPRPAIIQGSTNGVNWFEIGTAFPTVNGSYSISYPACLVGPIPQLRGCVVNLPGDGNCSEHISRAAENGAVAPMIIQLTPAPRTREYRIYRQTDDGPMSLISQGRTTYTPLRRIIIPDDVMPAASARLCYFAQVFDENGNASPMTSLGCREAQPPAPPQPILAEPAPAGTVVQPQVALNWFCPTAGVHRFRFLIKRVDKKPEPVADTAPSAVGFVSTFLTRSKPTRYTASFLRTTLRSSTFSLAVVTVDEGQLTPTLSSGFGPGPQFTLSANILPNVPYQISVQALNSRDVAGPISETWEFTWRPPSTVNNVPWPARGLPPVDSFDTAPVVPNPGYSPRVAAVLFTNVYQFLDDFEYPVGIRIGQIDPSALRLAYDPNIGTNRFARYATFAGEPYIDPHAAIFKRVSSDPGRRGESLLPIAVYRQQVTNAVFPRVSGDVIQVTPLIDRIPWTFAPGGGGLSTVTIPDRLIALREEVTSESVRAMLYLRDQQPVVQGARYRYLVVRFKSNREIDQIIPAGELEINFNFGVPCIDCE